MWDPLPRPRNGGDDRGDDEGRGAVEVVGRGGGCWLNRRIESCVVEPEEKEDDVDDDNNDDGRGRTWGTLSKIVL